MAEWAIEQPVFTRRAGVSPELLSTVRNRELVRRVDLVVEAYADLNDVGAQLEDALYQRIPEADTSIRAKLVGLRRSIHNKRKIPRSERSREVFAELSSREIGLLQEWDSLRVALQLKEDSLANLLKEDTHTWVTLALSDQNFARGLETATFALSEAIGKHGNSLSRHSRIALLRYFSRAGAKTSPYSTFTTTGIATPRAEEQPGSPTASVIELDQYVLDQFVTRLFKRETFAGSGILRVNPSIVRHNGVLRFTGNGRSEPFVQVRASPQLDELIDMCRQAATSLSEVYAARPDDGWQEHVDSAIELGLLELFPPFSLDDPTALEKIASWCSEAIDDKDSYELSALFGRLHACLGRQQIADCQTSPRQRLEEVHKVGARLAQLLGGIPWPKEQAKSKHGFHENALRLSAGQLQPQFQSAETVSLLGVITEWLSVFDRMLPVRLAAANFARQVLGDSEATTFVDFYFEVQTALRQYRSTENGSHNETLELLDLARPLDGKLLARSTDPRLVSLNQLRRFARDAVREECRNGPLTKDRLKQITSSYPAWISTRDRATFYAQTDGETIMINVVGAGDGRGRARWWRLLEQASGKDALTVLPSNSTSATVEALPIPGAFGSAGNLTAPPEAKFLRYPHVEVQTGAAKAINLGDLKVRLGPNGLLTLTDSNGADFRPGFTGLLAEPIMPPAARFLLALFGRANLKHPAFPIVQHLAAPTSNQVEIIPPVQFEHVVFERQKWVANVSDVPLRPPLDARTLWEFELWRRKHQIPEHVYIRLEIESSDWKERAFGKARKPQYLDLRSHEYLDSFAQMLRSTSGVVVVEAASPVPVSGTVPHEETVLEIRKR
ncbi:lantibiotic dehydratase [Rathayibacter iranicus]|uniref:lantibiotic dehydratase n=1 Tax=Rathayibacter iranicus TaxID=59737 RepID=UPI000D6B439A|nr:lantibiotic dehydratase [Rathayibacter iranicus]MWV30334.1 hypothetical protein [Rathayibacter iranicus NCPPB 2253 = VKM Ac-1602]